MRLTRRHQGGFTLMEMMIALLIGAVVVSPLYIVTRSMAQQADAQRMEIEATERARLGLASLSQDFSRAGLYASPNTLIDPLFLNKDLSDSTARARSAVVHMNRLQSGDDALMLSGNFMGSRTYIAYATAANVIQLQNLTNRAECIEQFDRNFAFANITSRATGKKLDARVLGASYSVIGGTPVCDLTLRSSDLSSEVLAQSAVVSVAASQTAVYWVETVEDKKQLVRYFVNYDSNDMPGDCNISGVSDPTGLDSVVPGSIVKATRKVIADYVENFQVWLRPVTLDAQRTIPHYYTVSDLESEAEGAFVNGFLPTESEYVFPSSVGSTMSNINDVSCSEDSYTFGAEDLRSAVLLLTVRSEMTDQVIDFTAFSQPGDRLIRHNLAAYTGEGDRPGACYKLKTLVTEVELVNLASRKDILPL